MNIKCDKCQKTTIHRHVHSAAHGISGTHMAGSERYECQNCGNAIHKEDGEKLGLKFILD